MTQTGINAILTGFAGSILTNDQIAQLLSQLISSANMNLKNIVTIICALYNSRTITLQQAMALLEKYISQMGNNSGSGTGTEPTQSAGLLGYDQPQRLCFRPHRDHLCAQRHAHARRGGQAAL